MPKAIDIFAGCGGLTAGLKKAGFDVIAAIEINPIAAETYRKNHEDVHLYVADVKKLRAAQLLRDHQLRRGELDLLAGCSPCQGFSRLRKGDAGENDIRNQLVFELVRLIRGLYPKTILMENVPGLIKSKQGKRIYASVHRELEHLGYKVDCKVIDTADYGIPQFRKRCVLLGSRYKRHPIDLPKETHSNPKKQRVEGAQTWRTVRQTIGNLPILHNGETNSENPLHRCSKNGDLNLQRIQAIPHDGGSRSSLPEKLVLQCHKDCPHGYRDVYGRMRWDYPAPTMTGGCTNITKGRFIHPEADRGISLLEAALFQTFPPEYQFSGNFGEISLQIGNAVPVELGYVMGNRLIACLNEIKGKNNYGTIQNESASH